MDTRRGIKNGYRVIIVFCLFTIVVCVDKVPDIFDTGGKETSLTAATTPGGKSSITCTAPAVTSGETATITCFFLTNVYGSSVNVQYRGKDENSKEQNILDCYYDVKGNYTCYYDLLQYSLERNFSDTIRIAFKASETREGHYTCYLLPASHNLSEGCDFKLSTLTTASFRAAAAAAQTDDEVKTGLSAGTIAGIAVGCVIALLLIFLLLLFYWYRRSRKSKRGDDDRKEKSFTQEKEAGRRLTDPNT